MKAGKTLGAVLALTLLCSTAAIAKEGDGPNDKNHGQYEANKHASAQAHRHSHARWARGHTFPAQYRHRQYIVSDWEVRHLNRPPRGYYWYRADNQYVLVRRSDGIISDIIQALQ